MFYPPINPVIWLIVTLLDIYSWIVLAAVIMSWLLAFNVVNYHNNIVRSVVRFLDVLTEPVFRQVRRFLPTLGGLDLSPIVVFIAIIFLQKLVVWLYFRFPF
ncbi:YggT family protein [Rhizomicrobium electricum]|jgi:YggT family protein|uniref:YggT family protein n=1 Tax=Rhizomicrobium electricum TaxID=480070 RepID=A0ABN1F3J3_9PROT|nr:YggT family protein [Rhizomicrobium electricum]NIJ49267.1 YggT family protein [Rhizomicrobium electricum]